MHTYILLYTCKQSWSLQTTLMEKRLQHTIAEPMEDFLLFTLCKKLAICHTYICKHKYINIYAMLYSFNMPNQKKTVKAIKSILQCLEEFRPCSSSAQRNQPLTAVSTNNTYLPGQKKKLLLLFSFFNLTVMNGPSLRKSSISILDNDGIYPTKLHKCMLIRHSSL